MIEALKKWVSEGNRAAEIKIRKCESGVDLKIWVSDYDLMEGQHIQSVEEIDLKSIKERKDREEFERLKAKYQEKEVLK